MKNRKNNKKDAYISPAIEVVEIEAEQSILQSSGEASSDGLQDFWSDDW